MVLITEDLIRKRSEHNECVISTLEELSLHQEDIERIEHLQNWCRNLKILLLQSNLISKIENLHKLKNLEYINLALNNIELIENLEGCESLQKLDLTLNFIGELVTVEKLKANGHLQELYLSGNPCSDYEGYRDFVVATLPQLHSLDGVKIERSDHIRALQNYDLIRPLIIAGQIKYRKKREIQKKMYEGKIFMDSEDDNQLSIEENEKFWKEMSENTPETRIELARHSRRSKEQTIQSKEKIVKRVINLFNKDGKPNNINEAKIPFKFEEDEERNCFVLTLEVYKYLDTSLLDVDVQPQYVTVKVKGKVFQITMSEEVKVDQSTVLRSQTTGHLVVTMPKVHGELKTKKMPALFTKDEKVYSQNSSKRQYLEIGMEDTCMDFSRIVENNNISNKNEVFRKSIEEKKPSREFQDDPNVPPLE